MDRALDRTLLGLALGDFNNLPSPDELAGLLAQAEIDQLLTTPETMPKALIDTGWALLGIASSRAALDRYGVAQQRAALQVAAHIFDLGLQRLDFEYLEHLELCFAAQIAYVRSEFTPNAMALYRREFPEGFRQLSVVADFRQLALTSGIVLLAMDSGYVRRELQAVVRQMTELTESWGLLRIEDTVFGAACGAARGAYQLMIYLTEGSQQSLENARRTLLEAVNNPVTKGDRISRWVAASLLDLADDLEITSVWAALPPQVPLSVRKAFTQTQPPMLTLWPPQLALFRNQEGSDSNLNPLDPTTKRQIISMPTSAGKTQMAHILVLTHLATTGTGVCVVAPTRSLCHEIRRALEKRLRFVRPISVMADLPVLNLPQQPTIEGPSVEVMTPERLAFLIRNDLQGLLERFGMFVIDEAHNVAGAGRGWTLETDLTHLHQATLETDHRMVLISAVIGNRIHFVNWLTANDQVPLSFHHDWRGPRRLTGIYTTQIRYEEEQSLPVRARAAAKKSAPLDGVLRLRGTATQPDTVLIMHDPVGTLIQQFKNNTWKRASSSTPNYVTLIPLIKHLRALGPVLVIESSKEGVLRLAKKLVEDDALDTTLSPELLPVIDLAVSLLGEDHPLPGILRRRVAYHHGSLPTDLRQEIEEAVSAGYLDCLIATTTMTEGVNLPVRSVVIASQGTYTRSGFERFITGPKLVNAIGRAGRAAKETEGIVVLAQFDGQQAAFDQLAPELDELRVTSSLATDVALEELAVFEAKARADADVFFEPNERAVSDFLSFVWFVVQRHDDLVAGEAEQKLETALGHTLAWVQLSDENKVRWTDIARQGLVMYRSLDSDRRGRWARAGVTLKTAQLLDSIALRVAQGIQLNGLPDTPFKIIDLFLGGGNLESLLRLPEAKVPPIYDQRRGNRFALEISFRQVLRDWLDGVDLKVISERHFNDVADVEFRFEQLGDFVYASFEMFLPWLLNTLIDWTNLALLELSEDSATLGFGVPTELAAFARWGVNDSVTLYLILRGVQSRRLVFAIAPQWQAHSGNDPELYINTTELKGWLAEMRLEEWQRRFNASSAELRSLLELVRRNENSIGARLLSGLEVAIEFEILDFPNMENQLASLQPRDTGSFSPIGVWIEGRYIDDLPTDYQSDMYGVLNSGLIIEVRVWSADGVGEIGLYPIEPIIERNADLQA